MQTIIGVQSEVASVDITPGDKCENREGEGQNNINNEIKPLNIAFDIGEISEVCTGEKGNSTDVCKELEIILKSEPMTFEGGDNERLHFLEPDLHKKFTDRLDSHERYDAVSSAILCRDN